MRLKRIKLGKEFRGLQSGFEFRFEAEQIEMGLQPYCMVGLNGSGKSNLLAVICEVFAYLESLTKGTRSDYQAETAVFRARKEPAADFDRFKKGIAFELEYTCAIGDREAEWFQSQGISPGQHHVRIIKEVSKPPRFECLTDSVEWKEIALHDHYDMLQGLLPKHVVGYSSGANELISTPFIRMDLSYYEDLRKWAEESIGDNGLDVRRLFCMDYDSNKLVTVCNFLFREPDDRTKKLVSPLTVLCDHLRIADLHSFSITIRYHGEGRAQVHFPTALNQALQSLRDCSTCYESIGKDRERVEHFHFKVDAEMRELIQVKFQKGPLELYTHLNGLRLHNAELYGKDARKRIREADAGVNIASLLPKPTKEDMVFELHDIRFKQSATKKTIWYRLLSDGEHQLMHIMGAMVLFKDPDILFLLDEPETHYNPEWRAQFIKLLNQCAGQDRPDAKPREQEIILTTHSPFVVSDCQQDRVFLFQRKKEHPAEVECKSAAKLEFNTFGASVDLITAKLFDYELSFGEKANEKLDELKSELEKLKADLEHNRSEAQALINRAYDELGESAERVFFIKEAMDQRDSPEGAQPSHA